MNEQDIKLLTEVLDDLVWAKSMLNIDENPCGHHLDDSIARLTARIEELHV